MGQCSPFSCLPCFLQKPSFKTAASSSKPNLTPSCASPSGDTTLTLGLEEALSIFRARGLGILPAGTGKVEPYAVLWAAACDLVENLLLGVRLHLPEVIAECTITGKPAGDTSVENADLLSMEVHFSHGPIVGEVATPSRFCHEVHLMQNMRFTLHLPRVKAGEEQLLVLKVSGLEFPTLPEMDGLRNKIKEVLGPDFTGEAAYSWWLQNKDKELPLAKSKFHRIYESIWGLPGAKMLPLQVALDFFVPFLIGTHVTPEAFTFHMASDMVRMTCSKAPGRTPEEIELIKQLTPLAQECLRRNRTGGERAAASSTNFGAMFHGPAIGQPAASALVITRLLSAAKWWGPGARGWQQLDQTWQCRDRKNRVGVVVERQGRIIWSLGRSRQQLLQQQQQTQGQQQTQLRIPTKLAQAKSVQAKPTQASFAPAMMRRERDRGSKAACCRRRKTGF